MRTHRFDPLSFVFGALFVALAVLALTDAVLLSTQDLRWIGPGLLVVIGLVLLATAGRRDQRDAVAVAPDVTPAATPTVGSATTDETAPDMGAASTASDASATSEDDR